MKKITESLNNGNSVTRRQAIVTVLGAGAAVVGASSIQSTAAENKVETKLPSRKFDMKKSINLWAFPYPEKMNLKQCFELAKSAGFDAVELNFDLENDISPKATAKDYQQIRKMAESAGLSISGLCSFLFWQFPLSSNDEKKRERGFELDQMMVRAASELGTENLLVVPGAVTIPWRDDHEPVPNDVCERRAKDAVQKLLPIAEKLKVYLNIENIFFNGFLMSPMEMNAFVDSFNSPYVRVHFDTGNIAMYQQPEHWIELLGTRIKNTHLKELNRKSSDYSLEAFRPLLDGTTNWDAVMAAFEKVGYKGYLTFEYFRPYKYHSEALIYHTSDALDRLLGRK